MNFSQRRPAVVHDSVNAYFGCLEWGQALLALLTRRVTISTEKDKTREGKREDNARQHHAKARQQHQTHTHTHSKTKLFKKNHLQHDYVPLFFRNRNSNRDPTLHPNGNSLSPPPQRPSTEPVLFSSIGRCVHGLTCNRGKNCGGRGDVTLPPCCSTRPLVFTCD
jgi:hypothetical protein